MQFLVSLSLSFHYCTGSTAWTDSLQSFIFKLLTVARRVNIPSPHRLLAHHRHRYLLECIFLRRIIRMKFFLLYLARLLISLFFHPWRMFYVSFRLFIWLYRKMRGLAKYGRRNFSAWARFSGPLAGGGGGGRVHGTGKYLPPPRRAASKELRGYRNEW